jgi:hypothetical protein
MARSGKIAAAANSNSVSAIRMAQVWYGRKLIATKRVTSVP